MNPVNSDAHTEKRETVRQKEEEQVSASARGGGSDLHAYAKVHHGHAGVPVPAHVHHGVTALRRGPLRRAGRRRRVVFRLRLRRGVLRAFWESQQVVTASEQFG